MTTISPPVTSPILTALRALYEGIPGLVFYRDVDGVYLGCNHAFCNFAGHTRETEIIGLTNHDLFDQETADFFRAQDLSVLNTHTAKHRYERVTDAKGNKVLYSFWQCGRSGRTNSPSGSATVSRHCGAG